MGQNKQFMQRLIKNMLNKILNLAKKFIAIESIPGSKKSLDEVLELALSNLSEYTIERFEDNGVKSALVYNLPKRPKKFKIILNGHLDVIPGKKLQYLPHIVNNRLYGTGSMDMKTNTSCLIMVFKEVAKKVNFPIGLQLVIDEEIGGFNGTKYQISKGVRADFVIVGESTGLNIADKAKGVLQTKVTSRGKTAHGAYPQKGVNAIFKMNKFLNILEKEFPTPSDNGNITTINLAKIQTSNLALNKIPDDCTIYLDIRYIPEESKTILTRLKGILPKSFKLKVIVNEPSRSVDRNNKYLQRLKKEIEKITKNSVMFYTSMGSSDARHYARVGCESVCFGSIGKGIGSDKEYVDIPSIEKYYLILKNYLLSLWKKK